MTAYYLDTSALIKHYHVEIGTSVVDKILVAIDVRHRHGIDYFVCADANLCKIAEAEGFAVINPMT